MVVILVEVNLLRVALLLYTTVYLVIGGEEPVYSVPCAIHTRTDAYELFALFEGAYLLHTLGKLLVAESEETVITVTVEIMLLVLQLLVASYRLGVVHNDATVVLAPITAVLQAAW